MVFVDNLAYGLFTLSFAGLLIAYTAFSMYMAYGRKGRNFSVYLRGAGVPLAILGAYMIISGLWGQFVWPLPGSYNTLFYDPFISFGMLLVGFAISVRYKARLEYIGFLGLMVGAMVLIYGLDGYGLGLTSAPLALLGLYFLFGIVGILSFPVALMADEYPSKGRAMWRGWYAILVVFLVVLVLASLLSAYTGTMALSSHLLSAP